MVNKEPVSKIVNLAEAVGWIQFREHQVNINEIRTNSIHSAEPHVRNKCDPGLDRVKLEWSDPSVLSQETPVERDSFFALSFNETFDRVAAAGMRLIRVDEFLSAIRTDPHSVCWLSDS